MTSKIAASALTNFRNRNFLINGNFQWWQRNTTQTSNGYGSDDRWMNSHMGSTKTHSQQIFPIGQTFTEAHAVLYSRTVVTSAAASGNFVIKHQRKESVRPTTVDRLITLTFFAKSDSNKNIAVEWVQNFGTGGSPSADVTGIGSTLFALTTSWQKFTHTVTMPSISGKTLGTNNDDFLELVFWMDAGSDFDARAASLGQQSGTFDIAQVQAELGPTPTDFDGLVDPEEYERCIRYYMTNAEPTFATVKSDTTTVSATPPQILNRMRAVPTATLLNGTNAFHNANITAFQSVSAVIFVDNTRIEFTLTAPASAGNSGQMVVNTYSLDAEL